MRVRKTVIFQNVQNLIRFTSSFYIQACEMLLSGEFVYQKEITDYLRLALPMVLQNILQQNCEI